PCSSVALNLLPPLSIPFLQQPRGTIHIPPIPIPSLVLDLRHRILHHRIPSAKDRTVRPQLIKPSPQRRCARIFHHHPIRPPRRPRPSLPPHPNPRDLRRANPLDPSISRSHNLRRWLLDPHQKLHYPHTLAPAQ